MTFLPLLFSRMSRCHILGRPVLSPICPHLNMSLFPQPSLLEVTHCWAFPALYTLGDPSPHAQMMPGLAVSVSPHPPHRGHLDSLSLLFPPVTS